MIEVFKKLDAKNTIMPQYLCNAHVKMSPASGFEVISEHLLGLIIEVSTVKERLNELDKNQNVTKILICARYAKIIKIIN